MTWKGEKARHGMSARGISTKNLRAKGYYEDQGKYYEQRVEMWVEKIVELFKREDFGDLDEPLTDAQLKGIAYKLIYSGTLNDLSNLVDNGETALRNLRVYDDLSEHTIKPGKTITINNEELEVVGTDRKGNIITRNKKDSEMQIITEEQLLEEYP